MNSAPYFLPANQYNVCAYPSSKAAVKPDKPVDCLQQF